MAFDTFVIQHYIHDLKNEICCVLAGYAETWTKSMRVIYCNGNYCIDLASLNSRTPNGRTPYVQIIFNNGSISFWECSAVREVENCIY